MVALFPTAIITELQKPNPEVYPVLAVTWPSPVGLLYHGSVGGAIGTVPIRNDVVQWGALTRAGSHRPGFTQPSETSVKVRDTDGFFTKMLESYNVSRAPCSIMWALKNATPGLFPLLPAYTATLFTGVLDRWTSTMASVTLYMRADDRPLVQGSVPNITPFNQQAFSTIPQASVGVFPQVLYGEWNSAPVTGQGFVPVTCTAFTAATVWEGIVSYGWIKSIDAVYVNGVVRASGWNYSKVIVGGSYYSKLGFTASFPAVTDIVTVDAKGLTSIYDGTGTLLVNPVDILRRILVDLVFGSTWTGGPYLADATAVDSNSFAAAAAVAAQAGIEATAFPGTKLIGGRTQQDPAQSVVDSWLSSNRTFRLFWSRGTNTLSCSYFGPLASGYGPGTEETIFRRESEQKGYSLSFQQDQTLLASQIAVSYLPDASKGQLRNTANVQDPGAAQKIITSVALEWSAAKLT